MKQLYGLLGRALSHSYSKEYFENKFRELKLHEHEYRNYELETIQGFATLIEAEPALRGLNVTYPYKEAVIDYLDALGSEAREIGAVNCIKIENGRTTGYNTDVYGFRQSIKPFLDRHHERALILGTGGGAKAVAHVLAQFGIGIIYVSSDPAKKGAGIILYNEVNEHVMNACKLVVNCTPLGMFPETDRFPDLPYQHFSPEHLAYDLVYNPEETKFMSKARAQGSAVVNGLSMLQLQAEKSWEIWNR